jgi:putative transposase
VARENPTWGRRRIQAELARLGHEVTELTVAKYMHRTATQPSPTWRAFLASHARDIAAVDFFLVPTLTYRLLFAFVVLRHHRRELLHLHLSDQPTAVWSARHILEAFPNETAPRYLLRDRDAIYGERFTRCLANMGIRDVIIAPRAPWQNARIQYHTVRGYERIRAAQHPLRRRALLGRVPGLYGRRRHRGDPSGKRGPP